MRANEEPIDDDGYDMEVRYLRKPGEGMGKYELRWCLPVAEDRPKSQFDSDRLQRAAAYELFELIQGDV